MNSIKYLWLFVVMLLGCSPPIVDDSPKSTTVEYFNSPHFDNTISSTMNDGYVKIEVPMQNSFSPIIFPSG